MMQILLVLGIFFVIYGVDLWFYTKTKQHYRYVSRRTFLWFLFGQLVLVLAFYNHFSQIWSYLGANLFFIGLLLAVLVGFSYALGRERLLVCHFSARTERCLTPHYVIVKGSELIFQQLSYFLLAVFIAGWLDLNLLSYLLYTLVLLFMYIPVIINLHPETTKKMFFGMFLLSAPLFYSFNVLEVFWPAVYLHALLYVFLWLMDANWEGRGKLVSYETRP